jgi:hypothetical protein
MERMMRYRVQVFYPAAGLFLNTNHESVDLDDLREVVTSGIFEKFRYRIVDDSGNEVPLDHRPREDRATPSIDDIARMLKVPVVRRFEDVNLPGWTDPEDKSS